MSRGLQLLLLSCGRARERLSPPRPSTTAPPVGRLLTTHSLFLVAYSLAPATPEVKVACSEDVDLPCTAPWDPQVPYTVSWVKVGAAMPAGWGLVDSFEGTISPRLATLCGCRVGAGGVSRS